MHTNEERRLQELVFRGKVAAGRRMAPGDKLLCGVRLFDDVRSRMLAGIHSRNPGWQDEDVEAEFLRQLSIARRLDEHGMYTPCGHA